MEPGKLALHRVLHRVQSLDATPGLVVRHLAWVDPGSALGRVELVLVGVPVPGGTQHRGDVLSARPDPPCVSDHPRVRGLQCLLTTDPVLRPGHETPDWGQDPLARLVAVDRSDSLGADLDLVHSRARRVINQV
jgi:hypothetical protein